MMTINSGFDAVQNTHPGKHYYVFYENADTYMEVMIPFFKEGLLRGERCLWLISDYLGWELVYSRARHMIEDLDDKMDNDQIRLLSASKWYFSSGRFDCRKALQNAAEFISQNQADGSLVIRAAGDVGDLNSEDWDELCAYEKKVNDLLKDQKIIGLCAYPIQKCTPGQTKHVMELHDDVLIGNL